jgi:chaperone modulatory protein CbpM
MKIELTDAQWLHEHAEVSFEELAELSGLSPELLRELVEYGALVPINAQAPINEQGPLDAQGSTDAQSVQWSFSAECVVAVQTVGRLREDFDLDANALSVALTLIERVHGLEAQLRELRTQFPQLRGKR